MAEGRLLRILLKAGTEGDEVSFRRAAEEVIQEERAKKHHLLANDLERILYGESAQAKTARPVRPVRDLPKDERGLDLLSIRRSVRDLQDIVVSDEVRSALDEVLLEQSRTDVLGAYGLKPAGRLLFCGPPGCGKTSAAEVLATELGLELAIVRFDAVVSSFLGETASNLRKVFDFLERERVVALFDEFDAIGKERGDASEHGELKRVVNSFLLMLDGYRGRSLLVAATNHEYMLDKALWRRFDDVLLFEKPNTEQVKALLATKLRGVRHELSLTGREFLQRFRGLSHADIERVVIRAIKLMVLKGREIVTPDLVEEALQREEKRLALVAKQSSEGCGGRGG
ncbi:AAA family ATPase [Cystobacter ferrugineus]|uniref:AAA family ATPase n=1 Tax=Cystobacter ferrugineus TaxID=83449 RepID=A0A1L9AYM6_9BACT|nr:ATP-binding protein [Cystobacter ferrugineus]OJH35115.1 AAA family ATPase [Cystobacter ferrugineus]